MWLGASLADSWGKLATVGTSISLQGLKQALNAQRGNTYI